MAVASGAREQLFEGGLRNEQPLADPDRRNCARLYARIRGAAADAEDGRASSTEIVRRCESAVDRAKSLVSLISMA